MIEKINKIIKELSESKRYVSMEVLTELNELTYALKEDQIPLTDEVKEKLKEIVKLLLKLQKKRSKKIKHDGYWQICIFDGGIDSFYGIVREPTADIISFLTTAHFKVPELKKSSRLKKAINKALFFEGVAYIGIRGDIFAFLGNTPENFRYMLRKLLIGLTPRYTSTYYGKYRELLPILSAFVKLYRELGKAYSVCYFLKNADLPPHLSYLKANRELVEFLKALNELLSSQNERIRSLYEECEEYAPRSLLKFCEWGSVYPFNVEKDYEELRKQFKEANFYPSFFKEPNFWQEEEKWL